MSKAQGQIMTIKFTQSITSDASGNEDAFTVMGKEYKWVNGPDNNGPLLDKSYQVVSVVPHPILDDKHIRLILDDFSRFPSVDGDLTVNYDASLGNLSGISGAVESFEKTFTPIDLIPEPNPNVAENVSVSPVEVIADLKDVEYINGYVEENITVAPVEVTATLIDVEDINP